MTLNPVLAFAISLAGNAFLSFGMVLQKRHIGFVGHKGERDAAFKRDRIGWIVGFTLMNVVPALNFIALLGLPTNVVAAITGSNVAFTALFSALLLGERLSLRVIGLTVFMFAAIALAGLRGSSSSGNPAILPTAIFIVLPLICAAVSLFLRYRRRSPTLAVLIAVVAGAFGGFMILPLKALGAIPDPSVASWLAAPWLWLYLLSGVLSFAVIQLAYKDGKMSQVAPAYYGLQVLWPAIASYFIFSLPLDPLQILAFVGIGVAVVLIAGSESEA